MIRAINYLLCMANPKQYVKKNVNGRHEFEHILICEAVVGRRLPKGSVVHHVNHDRRDNRKSNLVICQDTKFHSLIHLREKALLACGNANYRKCRYCKQWDDPQNMKMRPCSANGNGEEFRHRACHARYEFLRKQKLLTPDRPHYQFPTGLTMAQMRDRVAKGEVLV